MLHMYLGYNVLTEVFTKCSQYCVQMLVMLRVVSPHLVNIFNQMLPDLQGIDVLSRN